MNPQLARLVSELEAATTQAKGVVASIPPAMLGRRPDEASWSVAECIAHLSLTTDAYLVVIPPALDEARRQQWSDTGKPFRMEIAARLLAWSLEPPYRKKWRTPAAFVPGLETPAHALPDFLDKQQKLLSVLSKADGLDLGRIRIASPFAEKMKYNVYAAFVLIAVHQRRHLWQAEQVCRALLASKIGAPQST